MIVNSYFQLKNIWWSIVSVSNFYLVKLHFSISYESVDKINVKSLEKTFWFSFKNWDNVRKMRQISEFLTMPKNPSYELYTTMILMTYHHTREYN